MDVPDLPPGIHERVLEPGGRRYTLGIPEGYSRETPTPFVMILHWGGPVHPFTGRGILEGLVRPARGDLGAILAAPDRSGESWANRTIPASSA